MPSSRPVWMRTRCGDVVAQRRSRSHDLGVELRLDVAEQVGVVRACAASHSAAVKPVVAELASPSSASILPW